MAEPERSASQAKARARMNTQLGMAEDIFLRSTRRKIGGTSSQPMSNTAIKKPKAFAVTIVTPSQVTFSPLEMPPTMVKMMRPIMSSMTAAPRTIRLSGSDNRPRSARTRAVMPTLVAVKAAPATMAWMDSTPNIQQKA